MAMSHLALAVLLTAAASPETVLLTPNNLAEYDYFFECGVLSDDKQRRFDRIEPVAEKVDAFLRSLGGEERRVGPADCVVVYLRFAPKRKGIYALGADDLKAITTVSLLLREGDVVLNVPLRTEVDPGNYVHLHARFAAQKDLLPKMELMFEELGDAGKRTFRAKLKDFMEER
jgi:hypothetical protein